MKILPPQDFVNAMVEMGENVSIHTWADTLEWKIFKAGYNSAVKKAQYQVEYLYNMPKDVERAFESQRNDLE